MLDLVLVVAVIIVIFLVCRHVVNWYSRINERVELQKENNRLLSEILTKLQENK